MRFGEVSYIIDDEAAILVTVGSDLSVLVPPSMRGPAVFIDILVKYVRAITTDSRQNTQSQSPTYALQMDLDQGGDTPFYVNASPTNESCIFLAFKSESVTSHVKSAVESRVAATEEHMLFKHSESEAIDVSKRRLDNGSNELDHLTDPSSDNNDHSVQDGSTFPVESADLGFGRGPTQQQRPVSLVQEMIERATFRNDSRYNLPSIAMAVIDVSISRESEANAEGVNAVAQGMSDSNMISSLPGQSGLDLIDSASQVQDPLVEGERSSSKVTATKRRKKNTKDDNMVTILESRNEGLLKAQFQPRPSKPVGQVHRKVCAPEDSTPSVIPAKFPTTELHDGRDRISATPPSMSKPLFTKIDSRNGLKPQPTSTQITKPYVKATPKVSSIVPRQKKSGTQGKGQCTVKSATNVNDEFSLPQSPPSHGSSLSQVRSKEFAQKRSTIQKGDSQAATTRPAPSLQDTNSGMTRQLAKAAFAPSNVKDNSIIPSNDVAARDSAMWEEGLSVQPGDASRAQIARNRGNQSKKRSAKLPKAPVAGASDGKAATINNHGHASKSAQPRKVPAKFATEADVTPAARIQPRSKRAAAVKANKRIEHQLDSEEESNSEFMLVDTNVPRGVGQTPLGTVQNEAADTVKSKHTEGHDLITNTEADKDNTSMLKVTTTVTAPVLRSQGKKQANPLKPAVQGEIDSPNKANLIIPTKPTAAIQCPQSDSKLDVSSDASFSEQPGDDLTLPLNEITHDEREFDDGSPSLVSHHTVDVAAPLIENKIDTRPVVYSKAPLPTATALAKISDVEVWHCDGDRNVQSISQSDKHVEQAQGRCRGPVAAPAQQDRYTNKQDRPMGIPSKKGVSIGPKSSNPSKDPFAARLRNAMPDNANHSTQHIARQPKPKTSTSTHSEQVLVPTQVKGVDSVIEPHQEVRDRLPAQNLKMGIPSATSGSKRKAVEPEERLSKRVKAKALPHTSPLIPTKSGNVQKDAKTPNTSIDRKAAMVSFDKSGPRNQGMSSRRHVGGDNASSSAPLRRDLKAGSRVRGPARGTQAHAAKEIGSPERVPKASASLADALFATNKPPFQVINNQPDVRVSSQTRITAGGSPIVVMVNGRDNIVEENTSTDGEAVEDALTAARLDDDEDVTMNESRDDEFVLLGFDSSLGTHVDLASIQVPSRNRKQQPTSPLAASTFAKLNKHQVRDNGTIINVDTKKAVVPTLPHDPFEAAGSKRNSSFMEALRKSTVSEDVSREKAKAPKAGIRKSLAAMEDPDKTLVDDPRIRTAERSKEARAISSSSLSSSGSSNAADPTKVPEVNSKSGSDTAHECYAPHQENMYLVLSGIVNVSCLLSVCGCFTDLLDSVLYNVRLSARVFCKIQLKNTFVAVMLWFSTSLTSAMRICRLTRKRLPGRKPT